MQLRLSNQGRLHFIVFLWGFTGVLGALISLDALDLVWYRMGIAVLVLAVVFGFFKTPLRIPFKALGFFILAGLIIALHWITFFHAIKISNVSVTLACLSTGAFFTALLEPIAYKRKIKINEVILGGMAMIGISLIFKFERTYSLGILTALFSAFLSALFSVINGIMVKNYEPKTITFYELTGGWLVLSLFLVVIGKFELGLPHLNFKDWVLMLALSTFCTAYAFIVSVDVMKELSPFTVVLTINLEPIYGILLAWLVLGDVEKMSEAFYIGALLILASVGINAYLNVRKRNFKRAV